MSMQERVGRLGAKMEPGQYGSPTYPVIHTAPETTLCFKACRMSDYLQAGAVTGASWCLGYVTGKPMRGPAAATAATIGATAGAMFMFQNSYGRLMGYRENDREVKKYFQEYNPNTPMP